MFNQLRLEAARSMRVRDPMGAYQNDLEVKKQSVNNKITYIIVDNCWETPQTIFQGSKAQCEAFLHGIKYGSKCATADFASAF